MLAFIYIAQGDPVKARNIIDDVKNHATEVRNSSLLQMAESYLAEIALRLGNIEEAKQWAKNLNPNPFYAAFRFYAPQITLAKLHMVQNTADSLKKASELLSNLYDFYSSIHHTRLVIEILAIQSLVSYAQSNEQSALEKLKHAIKLSAPGGHIRIFVDLGPDMAYLLGLIGNQDEFAEHIDNILLAFDTGSMEPKAKSPSDQIVPAGKPVIRDDQQILSNREIDILSLLADRLSNKEIADNLSISPETVKKHALNIYQKLHVNSRREAVITATKRGIISQN